jgi:hypothetical protein
MDWIKRYFIQRRINSLFNACAETGGEFSPYFDALTVAIELKETP